MLLSYRYHWLSSYPFIMTATRTFTTCIKLVWANLTHYPFQIFKVAQFSSCSRLFSKEVLLHSHEVFTELRRQIFRIGTLRHWGHCRKEVWGSQHRCKCAQRNCQQELCKATSKLLYVATGLRLSRPGTLEMQRFKHGNKHQRHHEARRLPSYRRIHGITLCRMRSGCSQRAKSFYVTFLSHQ